MKKCVLNSDVLNDEQNIYAQIDDVELLKYEVQMTDNPTDLFQQLKSCMDELRMSAIKPKALLMPFTLYNNLRISANKIIADTRVDVTISYIELFEFLNGYSLPNIIMYVPDRFKDKVEI